MKLKPVIFVHGLGGRPEDFDTYGVRPYLIQHGDCDPDLLRLFDYGDVVVDGKTTYNYQGDIRAIAHRFTEQLDYAVEKLSGDSIAKGGPEKVSLVAFSMGGVISRYYLSCAQPDALGTVFAHKVDKLIEMASPNKGVTAVGIYNQVLRGSLLWRALVWLSDHNLLPLKLGHEVQKAHALMQRMGAMTVENIGAGKDYSQPMDPESAGAQQLVPGGPFLSVLNQPSQTPQDVRYFCMYGDIVVRLSINLLGIRAVREFHFGDFAMLPDNATFVPGAQPITQGFKHVYQFALGEPISDAAIDVESVEVPPYSHITFTDKDDVHAQVLKWLEA